MKINTLTLIILMSFLINTAFSQDNKESKIKFKSGLNYGIVSEQSSSHNGVSINSGIEIKTGIDWIRFNPNLTIGYHQEDINFSVSSINQEYLYPLQLETNIYFDLIKSANNSFAWTLGLGAYANITVGSGTMGSYGGYVGTGFNINPQDSRYSVEILPVNYMLGYGPRKNLFARISLKYRM
ncbi:MAG: hypothetical protein KAS71_15025 [Bacteroidales bacterium]|nr:hypothetical protein [Bacteroidales bacterium]